MVITFIIITTIITFTTTIIIAVTTIIITWAPRDTLAVIRTLIPTSQVSSGMRPGPSVSSADNAVHL